MGTDNIHGTIHSAGTRCESTVTTKQESIMTNQQTLSNTQQTEAQGTITTQVLGLCNGFEFFHTPDNEAYVTIETGEYIENYPIKSNEFHQLISNMFYKRTGQGLRGSTFNDLLPTFQARASFEGQEHKVYMRTAFVGGKIYVDLCNKKRQCVEISENGWKILNKPPVKFKRTKYMAALPFPEQYGDVVKLRKFINISDDDYRVLIGWLLAALKGTTPLPILVIMGGQGSGKSTATKIIRDLFDPSTVPLRCSYTNSRDLMITCSNTYGITMDNISHISDEMSDILCGIATGTGQSHRVLHTNREEDVLEGRNPIIINGIDGLPSRADFIDRAVLISPKPISELNRIPETKLICDYENDRCKIFGGLCDALAGALERLPSIHLDSYPRMADFVLLGAAAETRLKWPDGTFRTAYQNNQMELTHRTIESNAFIDMLMYYLKFHNNYFHGTISSLMDAVETFVKSPNGTNIPEPLDRESARQTNSRNWPGSPQHAGQLLTRFEPSLRMMGIQIGRTRGKTSERARLIEIKKIE
ncbi:MAG: hypothetical protein ACHQAX_00150 [Gammaproteobacteria bacterium]